MDDKSKVAVWPSTKSALTGNSECVHMQVSTCVWRGCWQKQNPFSKLPDGIFEVFRCDYDSWQGMRAASISITKCGCEWECSVFQIKFALVIYCALWQLLSPVWVYCFKIVVGAAYFVVVVGVSVAFFSEILVLIRLYRVSVLEKRTVKETPTNAQTQRCWAIFSHTHAHVCGEMVWRTICHCYF